MQSAVRSSSQSPSRRRPPASVNDQCPRSVSTCAVNFSRKPNTINKWLSQSHLFWRALVLGIMVLLLGDYHQATGQLLPPPKKLHRIIAGFYAYHPSYDSDKKAPIASTNKHSPTVVSPPLLYSDQPAQPTLKRPPPAAPKGAPTLPPPALPPRLASQKKAVHYHSYQSEQNLGGDYNHHHHHHHHLNSDSSGRHRSRRPKYHGGNGYHHYHSSHSSKYKKVKKYKKEEYYKKTSTKSSKGYKKSYQKHRQKGSSGYQQQHFTTGGFHSSGTPDWPYISKVYEGYLVLARKMAEYYGEKYHYPPHLLYWQIIGVMFES